MGDKINNDQFEVLDQVITFYKTPCASKDLYMIDSDLDDLIQNLGVPKMDLKDHIV